jgi:hypothetical protein
MAGDSDLAIVKGIRAKTDQDRLHWEVVPVTPPVHMVYYAEAPAAHQPLRFTLSRVLAAETSLLIEDANTGKTLWVIRATDPGLGPGVGEALHELADVVRGKVRVDQEIGQVGVLEAVQAI